MPCSKPGTPTSPGWMRYAKSANAPSARSPPRHAKICTARSSTWTPKARGSTTVPLCRRRCWNDCAVSGIVQPLWETEGLPINLGRAQHIAPLRTRRVVENRDRICRHPSCHSTRGLEVHHIIHWRHGGTTDTYNLCLLCDNHHDRHHKGEFSIHGNANDPNGLIFRDSKGRVIAGSGTPKPPRHRPATPTSQTVRPPHRRKDVPQMARLHPTSTLTTLD